MKNIYKYITLLTVIFIFIIGCEDSSTNSTEPEPTYSIVGRWVVIGFEETVLYQFTNTHRYTIYSTDGNFGLLEDAIPNPNEMTYNSDGSITLDLHFGNYLTFTPDFTCNGRVVNFRIADDMIHSTYIKENFNMESCN